MSATEFMEFDDYIARNDELLEILLHLKLYCGRQNISICFLVTTEHNQLNQKLQFLIFTHFRLTSIRNNIATKAKQLNQQNLTK